MRTAKISSILFLILFLASCGKSVVYDGHVYSKHYVPMANLVVNLRCTRDGKNPRIEAYSLVTDENGGFSFNQKIRKSRDITEIFIHSDSISGGVYSLRTFGANKLQDLEIVLK